MRNFLLLSLLLFAAANAVAQSENEQRDERIRTYRVAVFTETLKLTSAEAEKFWPAYNDYLAQRDEVQQRMKPGKTLELMSDNEVEEQLRKHIELKQRELDLEKDLIQKLRNGILPLRKIAKLPTAEREFREALIKKIQDKRQDRVEKMQDRMDNRQQRINNRQRRGN